MARRRSRTATRKRHRHPLGDDDLGVESRGVGAGISAGSVISRCQVVTSTAPGVFSSIGCIRVGSRTRCIEGRSRSSRRFSRQLTRPFAFTPYLSPMDRNPINELPDENPPIRRACPPTSGRLQQTALSWVKPPHPPRLRSHRRILRPAARRAPPRLLRSRRHRRPPAVTDPPRDPERPLDGSVGPVAPFEPSPTSGRPVVSSPSGSAGPPRYARHLSCARTDPRVEQGPMAGCYWCPRRDGAQRTPCRRGLPDRRATGRAVASHPGAGGHAGLQRVGRREHRSRHHGAPHRRPRAGCDRARHSGGPCRHAVGGADHHGLESRQRHHLGRGQRVHRHQ